MVAQCTKGFSMVTDEFFAMMRKLIIVSEAKFNKVMVPVKYFQLLMGQVSESIWLFGC
jgi:hypothetical protein